MLMLKVSGVVCVRFVMLEICVLEAEPLVRLPGARKFGQGNFPTSDILQQ